MWNTLASLLSWRCAHMPDRPTQHVPPRLRKTRRNNRFYYTKVWRGIRARFLANNPACPCGLPATEVDHIDGNTANNGVSNLQALCKRCHAKKTYQHDGGLGGPKCRLTSGI